MNADKWLEKEEDALLRDLNNGNITREEYNAELNKLHREYRDMAREAAENAYERELENW